MANKDYYCDLVIGYWYFICTREHEETETKTETTKTIHDVINTDKTS